MPAELLELDTILHSGALAYGKWGREFEQRLSDYLGVKHVLCTNTYGSAWQVLFATLGLRSDDEVIASPMACLQSNMPFVAAGLKVVWADIDPHTGALDPKSVERLINPNTRLIAHNHFCGYPGYIDEINAIGREHGIMVVDDGIEAFGSRYKDNLIGNVGTPITIFSFQTVRLPNTVDGGALVFDDEGLYQKAIIARDLGINRPTFRDEKGEISRKCDISSVGVAATPSDINSYIGCCQLDEINTLLEKQVRNAKLWNDRLIEMPSLLGTLERKDTMPNYWVFGILSSSKQKDMDLFRSQGYYVSSVHLPNSYYSVFGKQYELKGVTEFYNHFIALPCGWWM